MDIYAAISMIEAFLETYKPGSGAPDCFSPTEIKIVPSGDEKDTIKIWMNLGEGIADDQRADIQERFLRALKAAHPDVFTFTVSLRLESF